MSLTTGPFDAVSVSRVPSQTAPPTNRRTAAAMALSRKGPMRASTLGRAREAEGAVHARDAMIGRDPCAQAVLALHAHGEAVRGELLAARVGGSPLLFRDRPPSCR